MTDHSIVDAAGTERRRTSEAYDRACTRTTEAAKMGASGSKYGVVFAAEQIAGVRYDIAVKVDRAVHPHNADAENIEAARDAVQAEATEAAGRLSMPDDVAIHRAIEAYVAEWEAIIVAAEVIG